MNKGKILFVDTAHDELTNSLVKQGFECDYFSDYGRKELMSIANNYVGIIVRSKVKLDAEFLSYCTKLKFIGRVGAGMENIDVDYAHNNDIICLNAPEGNRDAVGEQAIGMLLTLFNNLIVADSEVRNGIWIREGNRGYELGGKKIGIIGYGNTGNAFARKLIGFDVDVLAYDKYKSNFSDDFVKESTMEEIFEQCDILSLHVPLTNETEYLLSSDYLSKFKKNIYVINTSRGKVVVTSDLISGINSGKVLGACLDVLEYEGLSFEDIKLPEEFKTLISMKNVVLSPHIAGWTHESSYKMAVTLADKIASLNLEESAGPSRVE